MAKRDAAKEPWWKRPLEDQIKQLRKDIARVEILKNGGKIKSRFRMLLQKKYWLKQKGYKRVMEELIQRIFQFISVHSFHFKFHYIQIL